jgi:zinc transport system substrate-binding protein
MTGWVIAPMMIAVLAGADVFAAEQLEAFAGLAPTAYLVERIGGRRVRVETLIRSDQDPHTFEPTPKQIQALAHAQLFFKVGMPLENQLLEKIRETRPELVVVDVTKGIEKLPLSAACSAGQSDHARAVLHEDSSSALDPHVWLSPLLLKIEAANIAAALEKIEPDRASYFRANLAQLQQELDVLDAKIRRALEPYKGRTFYVFHPAFGYFADCYQLKQEAIQTEGKQPSPGQLRRLIHQAKADGIKVIFVQPQFDRHSAQVVADALGGRIVQLNDMDKDVIANLQDIADKIATSFQEKDANH